MDGKYDAMFAYSKAKQNKPLKDFKQWRPSDFENGYCSGDVGGATSCDVVKRVSGIEQDKIRAGSIMVGFAKSWEFPCRVLRRLSYRMDMIQSR